MEFTVAELFLIQSVIGDGIKTLENIKAENLRASTQCVFSHQFVLNDTLLKAIDHRVTELKDLYDKFGTESASTTEAEQNTTAADNEIEVKGEAA
jgi:hypothetical protein